MLERTSKRSSKKEVANSGVLPIPNVDDDGQIYEPKSESRRSRPLTVRQFSPFSWDSRFTQSDLIQDDGVEDNQAVISTIRDQVVDSGSAMIRRLIKASSVRTRIRLSLINEFWEEIS